MVGSSKKSAAEAKSSGKRKKSEDDSEPANLLVKRKLKDDLETKEKHKQISSISSKMLDKLFVFNLLYRSGRLGNMALYCKDHKVWNKDFILREEDETPPPNFVENVLFVSNLSPQTKLFHIIDYFSHVGEVVSARLIVNPEGKHVGYGFVEFGSAYQAHKALEKMNGEYLLDHMIFIDVAKLPPYRLLPMYNFAEKLCYEDYLRRGILLIDEDETEERLYEEVRLDETPSFVEAVAVRNKTIFVNNLPCPTIIQDLIDLVKDVEKLFMFDL
ncbi:unnamed protein product [Brassica oleracea]